MIVVLLLIIACAFLNYKKTVLFCASTLVYMPNLASGIAGVKLMFLVNIVLVVLYYLMGQYRKRAKDYPNLIIIPCALAAIGYLISHQVGESKNLPIIIVHIINYFWFPYVVWYMMQNEKDANYCLKTMYVFFLVVGGYALIEVVMGYNIFNEIASSLGVVEGTSGLGDDPGERFGITKCSSILPYSSSFGMACAFMFAIVLLMKSKYKQKSPASHILFVLMPFCVLLSGTRSQLIVLLICAGSFFLFPKFRRTKEYKTLLIAGCVIFILFTPFIILLVNSVIHSNDAQIGSSSDMRHEQLEICLYYTLSSPLFGHGRNYIWDYVKPENPRLYGAESVWFQLMVDYGFYGCMTYLLIILGSFWFLYKRYRFLCFLPIAYIVGKTLSFVIGMEIYNMLVIFAILVRKEMFFRKSNLQIGCLQ